MLINTTPELPIRMPYSAQAFYAQYVVLVPSSSQIGKVTIEAKLFANAEAFFNNNCIACFYVAEVDFNLNQAGLLSAIENRAMELIPHLERCAVPVPQTTEE